MNAKLLDNLAILKQEHIDRLFDACGGPLPLDADLHT
jgi:hypothetical protein